MIGDLVLYIQKKWNQTWCLHSYKIDRISVMMNHDREVCEYCNRIRKL